MVAMTTIVAPVLSGTFAYLVTRRRDSADAGKSTAEAKSAEADTAGKWRSIADDEREKRREAENECDKLDDAFRQCVEENAQLRAENRILRDQVTAAGLPNLLLRPDTRPLHGRKDDK